MLVKLFDIENDNVVPTEHCHTLKFLKEIMDHYEENETYLEVYKYLFYMTCPNPDLNPFFNLKNDVKEERILDQVGGGFTSEDDLIMKALPLCKEMYETPATRAYYGIKAALDNLADYMAGTKISHGRDGNINSIVTAAAKFDQVRQSFKGAFKDLMEEQAHVRGDKGMAYDQE